MPAKLTAAEKDQQRRLAWFRQARFGMFIHWGLYAQLGRHEWAMEIEHWPLREYEKLAKTWHPRPRAPREWARLAAESGCRYMVMTTKHHEGFCLFDSALTDYNAVKQGPGRDLVAEYVEACREFGLRIGFYYSLMDWHHPDGMRCKISEPARRRFVDYIHGQIRELLTNYGKIDIMWYDVSYPLDAAGWESEQMNRMVLTLQPDIIINNRNQLPGDFGTPEEHVRPEERMWEACMTTNQSWGYAPIGQQWRTAWEVVDMLRICAAGGGNLLLNLGPAPDGSLPAPGKRLFREVGRWLDRNGKAIYEATDPVPPIRPFTGACTAQGNTLYFHCRRWPGTELVIGGIANKVLSVRYLVGGAKVKFTQTPDQLFLHGLPEQAPDPLATVFALELDGRPKGRGSHMTIPQPKTLR